MDNYVETVQNPLVTVRFCARCVDLPMGKYPAYAVAYTDNRLQPIFMIRVRICRMGRFTLQALCRIPHKKGSMAQQTVLPLRLVDCELWMLLICVLRQ